MSAFAFDLTALCDWLGTFALHSTLALGSALAFAAALRRRALALQEALLRAALWLPVFSASLQCALRGVWMPELVWSPEATAEPVAVTLSAGTAPIDAGAATEAVVATVPWTLVLPAAAVVAALAGLVWLVVVHRRLGAILRSRRPETDGRVLTTAAEVARSLGLRQTPHLSRSAAVATPIAFGMLRPEICLPERVGELGHASLRAMLAHEVAHLRAADPAWMWGAAWLQALFPWQPLFVVVRRRWARLVELRCDAIAAEHASPTAVARCLLDVADWLRPGCDAGVAALGMAARPSALRERVEAALHGASFRPARRGLASALGGCALVALTAAAPAVATNGDIGVAVADALPGAVAPEPVGRPAVAALLQALDVEHAALVAEAERLRGELRTLSFTAPGLGALERRLQDLARRRQRLAELLASTPSTDR